MAGNTIGKAALILGTKDEGMKKGLDDSKKNVQGWAVDIGAGISFVTNSFAGLAGAVLFKGFSLSLSEISGQINTQFDEIDKAAKAASRTGTDIDRLLGLEHAGELAGANAELMRTSLDRLNKTAATGSKAFERLGISQSQLQSEDVVGKFHLVADGIAAVEDQATRAMLAQQLFGKSGALLLPMLQQGSQVLRDQAADYERIAGRIGMGGALDVEAANDAATRAQTAWTGLIRWLTVQLAPIKELTSIVITELLAGLRALMPESLNLGDILLNAFDMAIEGAANFATWVVDGIDAVLTGFDSISEPIFSFIDGVGQSTSLLIQPFLVVVELIREIGNGIVRMGNELARVAGANSAVDGLASGIANVGEALGLLPQGTAAIDMATVQVQGGGQNQLFDLDAMNERIRGIAGTLTAGTANIREQWNGRRNAGEATQIADAMNVLGLSYQDATTMVRNFNAEQQRQAEAAQQTVTATLAAEDALEKINTQIAQFGMTQQERQIADLAGRGATAAHLEEIMAAQEQLRLMEEGSRLTQQFASPAATLTNRLADLDRLFAAGAISTETYSLAMEDAISQAERAAGVGEIKLATAALEGSREAVSAVMRHQISGGLGDSPEERILRVQEQQRGILQQILQAIRPGVAPAAVDAPVELMGPGNAFAW